MATSIANFLQGGSSTTGAVPGVKQVSSAGSVLQPAAPAKQLQGSSPALQVTQPGKQLQGSSPKLQVTSDPNRLPSNAVITPASKPAVAEVSPPAVQPSPTPAPEPAPAPAPVKVLPDRTNDINQNLAALEATRSMLSGGLGSISNSLAELLGRYGTEAGSAESGYRGQSDTNKNNFLKNVQSALVNAAQGRQGLFGVLSSLGALNGSGIGLANNAVQQGANEDISGANDTFGTNQAGLDTSIGAFRTADEQRRKIAEQAKVDAERALRSQIAQKQQSIYGNLSNNYADMEQADQAKQYSELVASLFPEIATNAIPAGGPTYQAAGYNPVTLDNFLSGGSQVRATPASGSSAVPGLQVYVAPVKRKDQ